MFPSNLVCYGSVHIPTEALAEYAARPTRSDCKNDNLTSSSKHTASTNFFKVSLKLLINHYVIYKLISQYKRHGTLS